MRVLMKRTRYRLGQRKFPLIYRAKWKWHCIINVNINHTAWIEAKSPRLCLSHDRFLRETGFMRIVYNSLDQWLLTFLALLPLELSNKAVIIPPLLNDKY
jgi:hypothetical protein